MAKIHKIIFSLCKILKKTLTKKLIISIIMLTSACYMFIVICSKIISVEMFLLNKRNSNELFSVDNTAKTTGDKLEEYFRIHEHIARQMSLKRVSINYYYGGGYGNRLCSFISSLLIGILTNSQTIVVNWSDIENYIDPPISNLFTQSESFYTIVYNYFYYIFRTYYVFGKEAWKAEKNINMLMKTHIPLNGFRRYVFYRADCLFMEICTNKIYFKKLTYYNLVSNRTASSALYSINNNETDHEKKEKLFRVGFEVGGNLLNKMWKPNKDIQNEIDSYYDKEFKSNYIIGIQLRYGRAEDAIFLNESSDTIKFIDCALNLEKNYYESHANFTRKNVKWFIASDSEKNLNNILATFPGKAFSSKGKVAHIAFHSEGYRRTVIDIELLSKCDELIITGGSTFGFVVAMKTLKLPYFINGYSKMTKCSRTLLADPPVRPNGDEFSAFF
jgi:hypothetical protein